MRQSERVGKSERLSQGEIMTAWRKANRILDTGFPRISPATFSHYSLETLAEDAAKVEKARDGWDNDFSPEGTVVEGFIFDMIGNAGWFGERTSIARTSEYDDYINHIDALVRIRIENSGVLNHSDIGLGLDATTNTAKLKDKIQDIVDRVRKGYLGVVKYAQTDNFTGELRHLPEVVLFVDKPSFLDVIPRWTLPDRAARQERAMNEDERQQFNALAGHQLQLEFLLQIYLQLQGFKKFAKQGIQQKLTATGGVVFHVLQERMAILGMGKEHIPHLANTPSVNAIRDALDSMS